MGAKKRKQGNPAAPKHATQAFGELVSRAALNQLLPDIKTMVAELGSKIALEQANSMELLYLRLLVLEQASGLTQEELTERVTVLKDSFDGLEKVEESKLGDTLRIRLSFRENKEGANYNEPQDRRIEQVGTGKTLGPAIEAQLVNLKVGDEREFPLGEPATHTAKVTITRVSRPIPQPQVAAPEVAPEQEPVQTQPAGDANVAQVQG